MEAQHTSVTFEQHQVQTPPPLYICSKIIETQYQFYNMSPLFLKIKPLLVLCDTNRLEMYVPFWLQALSHLTLKMATRLNRELNQTMTATTKKCQCQPKVLLY